MNETEMGVVMSLELVFEASRTLEKFRSGPLGNRLDGFCDWLLEQGFSRSTIRLHLVNVSHFNEFLGEQNRSEFRTLSIKEVNAFFKVYPSQARNRGPLDKHVRRVRRSINRFVQYRQHLGRFDSQHEPPVFATILEDYLQWMHDYRHVTTGTLEVRRHSISEFLKWLGLKATYQGLAELTPEVIEQFFLSYAETTGPSARRSMQAALRTFLRFCLQKGVIQHPLDKAVPTLHTYKLATVPRGLSHEQALKVLHSVNRKTPVGRRDYAILQLLYTYGVRGGQVRALQLTDIQWSKNQILFKALKHGKDSLLPLTEDVGKSLLDYLKKARPDCTCPEVFLTSRAPYHRLVRSNALSAIVCRYIIKSHVKVTSKGPHALRHCFATRMVQAGHPLKSVADVLGHRCLSTTFIYTKIDFNALKQVALEWPQEVL
jgi:integrase/recombinase XerD